MDLRDIVNTAAGSSSPDNFFSRILSRFTGNLIMSIAITLFTLGILAVVFIYIVLVMMKSL
jgi:hypothetical protein